MKRCDNCKHCTVTKTDLNIIDLECICIRFPEPVEKLGSECCGEWEAKLLTEG